ncbi:MAG: gamma-glutamyl-gamma-aminobutyrate hydrolase family protein [Oscillospiraceae bacterium]
MKPLIGLTCNFGIVESSLSSVSTPHMPQEFNQLSDNYIKAIEKAGGIPIIIPIYSDNKTVLDILERVDGVILTGGGDIGSHHFGERPSSKLGTISNDRDEQELFIANYILYKTAKPLLGICRGMQVMNVAGNGTLYQDLEECGFDNHCIDAYPRYIPSHQAVLANNSFLHSLFKTSEIGVNSYHHQAVKDVAENFIVTAKSEDDVIEAIEYKNMTERFALGLQWHPESLTDFDSQQSIFSEFINRTI